ncbi:CAMK family protein kinase [Histomonas meleagridis]|nr:CAMK family protein kinase [Histomonas meleagridis]
MALQILHSHELMHLDVSPGNILMTNDGHFKLADFGTLTKINHFTEGDEGAGPYVSPEALAYPNGIHLVTTATDIFLVLESFLMEAVTGKNAPRGGSQSYAKTSERRNWCWTWYIPDKLHSRITRFDKLNDAPESK